MVNFTKLEEEVVAKAEEAVRSVVQSAAANEPTVGAAVSTALEHAGVPPTLIGVAVGLVENLLAHFTPKHSATVTVTSSPAFSAEPAQTPSPEPAQSEPAPAEAAPEAAPAAPPFPEASPA